MTTLVIPDGIDPKNGKPHKLRLYSIASSAPLVTLVIPKLFLCVKRLVYTNEAGETVKGVCSNFLCDLKPGSEVTMTGPIGKEMLMPKDPNATIIMLATGTGIAPFRSFLWKMFFEKHEDYKFEGLAWLFLGVPTSSSLLYKEEFEKMKPPTTSGLTLLSAESKPTRRVRRCTFKPEWLNMQKSYGSYSRRTTPTSTCVFSREWRRVSMTSWCH